MRHSRTECLSYVWRNVQYGQVQHCDNIAGGQEERKSKTTSVVWNMNDLWGLFGVAQNQKGEALLYICVCIARAWAVCKLLTDLSGDAEDLVDARLFACICRRFGVWASKCPLALAFEMVK